MTTIREAAKTQKTPALAAWLEKRCQAEGLSFRQAATKTGISHATIASIIKGVRPSAATVVKLAKAFGSNGQNHVAELEDELLGLCGYRSAVPEIKVSEPLARLLDKLSECDEERLKLIESFVDFSATLGNGQKTWRNQSR